MNHMLTRDPHFVESSQFKMLRDASAGIARAVGIVIAGKHAAGLGGTRETVWPNDAAMVEDCFRLAIGMNDKSAFHDLPFNGAKVCVELNPGADRRTAFLRLGEFVDSFGGCLKTTEDLGTSAEDMSVMHEFAPHDILGRSPAEGGSGDPSPYTAAGVLACLRAVSRQVLGHSGALEDVRVFVNGVGHVGNLIVRGLIAEGADVSISRRAAQSD